MLAVQDIRIEFGARVLFRDLGFVVAPHDRIAVVGPNGAGKTTLMKVLAGKVHADGGRIIAARGVQVGYLAQEGVATRGRTVFEEVESAFAGVRDLEQKIEDLGAGLEELDAGGEEHRETLERMGDLQLRLEEADTARIRPRIETVLTGLGFARDDFDRPCEEFSGGWQMRIALGRLLLEEPDLLLLDEPTNHLDLDSLRWVEKYLQNYRGAIMLISHDRRFLDALARRTLAFAHGRVEEYAGNYSFYERESVARREQLEKAKANQDREIEKTQRFINRFRAKNTKASQVQSRIKMLEKLERIELDHDGPEIRFSFPPAPASGQSVVTMEGVDKRYGDIVILDGFDFTIARGDRIAVVGVNGAGKSTFSRLVSRREKADAGKVEHGYHVVANHFAQDQAEELDPGMTALETLEEVDTGGAVIDRRSVLGCFLFRGDDVFKRVEVLSGGEKSRLALARMLLQPSNFLILDEPTNHLDMASQARLQGALMDYTGSFVIVSHNRDFLDPLVNKVLEFIPGRAPRLYLGNVSDYIAKREEEEREAARLAEATGAPRAETVVRGVDTSPSNRKEQRKQEARLRQERSRRLKPLQEQLEALEEDIATRETDKHDMAGRLSNPETFSCKEEITLLITNMRENDAALEKAYSRWDALTEEIEQVEAELGAP